jgi:hypothetical protein
VEGEHGALDHDLIKVMKERVVSPADSCLSQSR